MGDWDAELIDLLPDSVRVFASAGAGFDWADVKLLGEKGTYIHTCIHTNIHHEHHVLYFNMAN